MTKAQRLRYEMFVRVRNFGVANRDVFPESTAGGRTFAHVAEAVAAIEEFLARRTLARAEARKVKATTRTAVTRYMKAIASTGRRAAMGEWGTHPFRMPARKSTPVMLTTARLFLDEAERRQEKFIELGMPPTFLRDFQKLIDELALAVSLQHDSRGSRRKAQAGLDNTLSRGFAAILDLDVTVANALRDDPVRFAQWEGARRIDGQAPSSTTVKTAVTTTPAEAEETTPVHALEVVLEKAS